MQRDLSFGGDWEITDYSLASNAEIIGKTIL